MGPEGLGIVADVVDGHETDAREQAEDDEELPEFESGNERPASDVERWKVLRLCGVITVPFFEIAWD